MLSKKRYLLVDIKDVEKMQYVVKREAMFNDFENVYYAQGWDGIVELFNSNNIPVQLQRIVIEVGGNCFHKNSEEFFTGYKFNYVDFEKDGKAKSIYAMGTVFNGNTILDGVRINAPVHYVEFSEVVKFYKTLSDEGRLKEYYGCLNRLFDLRKNIDLVFENLEEDQVYNKFKNKIYNKNNRNWKW